MIRKFLQISLVAATALGVAAPAFAQDWHHHDRDWGHPYWHRHYYQPGYVYAPPPPVVYGPSFHIVVPLR
jgi:hypothetical protein